MADKVAAAIIPSFHCLLLPAAAGNRLSHDTTVSGIYCAIQYMAFHLSFWLTADKQYSKTLVGLSYS